MDDKWDVGDAYEAFMGRWSRRVAERFVRWIGSEAGLRWLDVGCGTGALTSAICGLADPSSVVACDSSEPFVEHTRNRVSDPRVSVVVADADSLPETVGGFDVVVSGLVLNFLPGPLQAIGKMRARACSGGVLASYVWDYAGRMELLRVFWDEAVALNPAAQGLDEGIRFPMCRSDVLESLFRESGMRHIVTAPVDIPMRFDAFADYWEPFLGGTGPAPAYLASLDEESQRELRSRLERRLTPGPEGAIELLARAWAIRGTAP